MIDLDLKIDFFQYRILLQFHTGTENCFSDDDEEKTNWLIEIEFFRSEFEHFF